MSDIIQLLPDAIASQIAAGEVIQRPASVVKELMENAIDAGADHIQLIIRESGKNLIQVIDNGCGMSETDARMCFERHATSKLRVADDLTHIRTMGFRGEAMATIAAIAQVELKTRRYSDELGVRILMEGSALKSQEPCQTASGTSISVKNLFFNVPARRNFLKSNSVEMRHILDEFQRVALAHPDIFFSLHHNDSETYHLPVGNLRQRIVGIFGNNYNQRLVPASEETDILQLSGFVGKPEFAKKSRGDQFFFVNRRYIKSSYLHHAVMSAYEELLPQGVHPFYVLFLNMDPARIDVNVHPTKQEIKFDDEKLVYNYLKVAVRHALGQYSVTPTLDFEQGGSFSSTRMSPPPRVERFNTIESSATAKPGTGVPRSNSGASGSSDSSFRRDKNNLENWQKLYEDLGEGEDTAPAFPETEGGDGMITIESKMSQDLPLGPNAEQGYREDKNPYQLHHRYIVNSIKSGFVLIDQQAAHERILYEQYLQALEQQKGVSQGQLFAQTIELSPTDAVLLSEMLPELKLLGFDIEEFGQNAFVINGLPTEIAGKQNEVAIIDQLISQYREQLDLKLGTKETIARAMARSAAIKRGKRLDVSEMQLIINQLFACSNPMRSPSGRSCYLTFSLDELEQKFAE
ncbi:DNA mismatch repair endonuclease MutL [Lewinella cohaerens]|uniref:DNA mismatch repair endonuclease MutL n=1 Tax=Lewinella cohaerens TaxID=70995 RepID=UPI00036DD8CB|nr:DNA mismatch repair endonuclease MutL [Lewinella cohaerens]